MVGCAHEYVRHIQQDAHVIYCLFVYFFHQVCAVPPRNLSRRALPFKGKWNQERHFVVLSPSGLESLEETLLLVGKDLAFRTFFF